LRVPERSGFLLVETYLGVHRGNPNTNILRPPSGAALARILSSVFVCYIDESGGFEAPDYSPDATPAMVILGLVVDTAQVPALTRDFLALKRNHFPGRFRSGRALSHILLEIKGNEILQMTRSQSRNPRRQAQRFRDDLLDLATAHGVHLLGRIWVKAPGKSMDPVASYCFAMQDIAKHFSQYLQSKSAEGVMVADSRTHSSNVRTAQSVFTQKWRTGSDPYPFMGEVPLFGHSDNHAGLQVADLIASTLVFPMAACAYGCKPPGSVHASSRYNEVRRRFGERLRALQYRYRDETGHWRGGLVVSDHVGHQPGSALFGP
jgi:hypothetical protein